MRSLGILLTGVLLLAMVMPANAMKRRDSNDEVNQHYTDWKNCVTELKDIEKTAPGGITAFKAKQKDYKQIRMALPQLQVDAVKTSLTGLITYTAAEQTFLNTATGKANACNVFRHEVLSSGSIFGRNGVNLQSVIGQEILETYITLN